VLGIVWLFWVGSVAGLILGIVRLNQAKARNERGRGLAIAGIVLSSIWLVILVFFIIGATAKSS
jgi:hypothetical protein